MADGEAMADGEVVIPSLPEAMVAGGVAASGMVAGVVKDDEEDLTSLTELGEADHHGRQLSACGCHGNYINCKFGSVNTCCKCNWFSCTVRLGSLACPQPRPPHQPQSHPHRPDQALQSSHHIAI